MLNHYILNIGGEAPTTRQTITQRKGEPMSNSTQVGQVPGFLERDLDSNKKYVKYHRLLAKAEKEGRIDGDYVCPVCGMHYMTYDEADVCCKPPNVTR